MSTRIVSWTAAVLAGLASCSPQSTPASTDTSRTADVHTPGAFDRALAEATRTKKFVLVDFFTTWCAPCKRLEKETWNEPGVRAWLGANGVDLRIDAEVEVELARRYRVGSYPTILLLNADGTEVDRFIGFRDAPTFLEELESAKSGKTSLARAKEKLVGREKDMMARKRYARELEAAGQYEEALKEYLRCYDETGVDSSFTGVRSSFLLSDILELSKKLPAAREALESRRDAAEQRVRERVLPPDTRDQKELKAAAASVADAASLNRELGTLDRVVSLYDELKTRGTMHKMQRQAFSMVLVEPFVEKRRYQDALDLFDKPEGYVKGVIDLYKTSLKPPAGAQEAAGFDGGRDIATEMTIERSTPIYEALLGTQQVERASKVADQLTEYSPTWQTYVALIEAASRAGAIDVARQVGARGQAVLADPGPAVIKDTLSRLPK